MNKFLSFFVFCFLFIINSYAQTPDGNGILYVKAGGGGDGSSWANALGEVADALKAATTLPAGTVKEIWVAGGTWYPLYAADFASMDNRDKAFVMVKNVNLYGGFAGTETALSDRDLSLTANKTILSGDLGTKNVYTDNAYHVMVAAGAVGTAKLDGFTLSYGSSSDNSSIASLAVNGNAVYRYVGGGMIVLNAGPVISNVIFSGNSALAGGGIYILSGSNAVLTNCVMSGNIVSASGSGAFIYNATVVFTNVTVAGNNATGGLAAIFFSIGGNGTIRNSIIYGNSSGISSMGTYTIDYSMDQGSSGNPANHVLPGADPLFANSPSYTSAPFTSGNYALGSGSPVADQGSNSLFTGLSASSKDIIGNPRVSNYTGGGIIDMGAYEYKVPLSQTITVADAVKTYGDPDFEPVASASSGLAVTLQSSDATIANPYIDVADGNKWKIKILKAGVVTITASQAGNGDYASAPNKTFTVTVNKAALTVTADDATKIYDGVGYSGGNGASYSGFVNSETAGVLTGTLSYSGSSQGAVNVGNYVISPSGLSAANYTITYVDGSLSIGKAALTVTANNATKTYDGVGYSGGNGVSYSGFVNSENAGVLTGTLTYSGSSQGAVNAGNYVISPSGLSAANYTITYVDGSLSIGKAALTV
uniref:MBG domain-containing protein n=1 Tax=Chitinophaga sancti TaxID=1004 RepID=UPI003F7A77ED